MKSRVICFVILFALSLAGTAFAADGIKLASIDLTKIAQESRAGGEARKTLEAMTEKLGKGLKKKEAELDKLKAALEGQGKQLSAKERVAKGKEFQKKIEAYRQAAQSAQKELQAKEQEYLGKLITDVEKTVKEYAPKNGYALVIRKGDVIYDDGKTQITDVTDDILKVLDKAPAETAPKQDAPKK